MNKNYRVRVIESNYLSRFYGNRQHFVYFRWRWLARIYSWMIHCESSDGRTFRIGVVEKKN